MLGFLDSACDVEHGEHAENESLQERHQKLEREEEPAGESDQQQRAGHAETERTDSARKGPRDHAGRQQEHHGQEDMASRHVAEKPESQGERTREMAEDLDDEEERDQDQLEGEIDDLVGKQLGAEER